MPVGGRRFIVLCCALAALAALIAGCGDEAEEPSGGGSASAPAEQPASSATTPAKPRLVPNPWKEPGDIAPHPRPSLEHVLVHEVKKGAGPAVHPYDTVMIDFIQALWSTGRKFYMGWGKEPFPTTELLLDPIEERRGLVRGMDGMRVGGRRQIVSPPRLSGIETKHNIFRRHVYWDVVLRGIVDHGERPSDEERGFAPNPWPEPRGIEPHPNARVDRVIVRELAKGRGPGLFANASMFADFIEANYATGRTLYRAWGKGPYAPENLENAAMMRGFQIGVKGMRVGGRRQIIIPPRLSDVDDPDRRGPTYRQPIYFDIVLRWLKNPVIEPE